MTKKNKISVNDLDAVMSGFSTEDNIVNWHGLEVTVKRALSLDDVITFVNGVVESCFSDDDGSYMPEVKKFVTDVFIINMYTNITLPANTKKKYDVFVGTDLVDSIIEYVSKAQLSDMIGAIDSRIDSILNSNISNLNRQMSELFDRFNSLQERIGSTLSDVDSQSLSAMVDAIADGQIDEEKIVSAYMKAAANNSASKNTKGSSKTVKQSASKPKKKAENASNQ